MTSRRFDAYRAPYECFWALGLLFAASSAPDRACAQVSRAPKAPAGSIAKPGKHAAGLGSPDPDDRLSADDQALVNGLIERHMPELVEELLAHRPLMYHAHIARAFARSGLETKDPAMREAFCEKAADCYRRVLELHRNKAWFHGESRRFDVAQWYVEQADLFFRYQAAADLDRFEITSGLEFDRARLSRRLSEAQQAYRQAKALLDDLRMGQRTDEERFLLMGLTEPIARLAERRDLDGAWVDVYLGMTGDGSESDRAAWFAAGLTGFDSVARTTRDAARKYIALIGAGIALRESGHVEEANAAFDRVIASTAGVGALARARYEKVRALIKAGQFDAARREAGALGSMGDKSGGQEDGGARFYVALAPVLLAYSDLLQSRTRPEHSPERRRLSQRAVDGFSELSRKGGPWPEIVQVYLRQIGDRSREPASLSDAELRADARRAMAEQKYDDAIKSLRVLAGRSVLKKESAEDRFNLAVCYVQTQRIRPAADEFSALAELAANDVISEKSAEYAYRCWRQLAGETHDKNDYARLAGAADVLVDRFATHPLRTEAAWVGGLAHQESGDFAAAIRAYEKVSISSPDYWPARQRAARCCESLYESLSKTTSPKQRGTAATQAVGAWRSIEKDLLAAGRRANEPPHRDELLAEAREHAASILVGDDLNDFQQALVLLSLAPANDHTLTLRIAAHRGLGQLDLARKTMDELLQRSSGDEAGAALLKLAAELESRVTKLQQRGRAGEAKVAASEALPTMQQLLDWLRHRPDRRAQAAAVQLSIISLLRVAGRLHEAERELGQCMAADAANGDYIRAAALLQEDIARSAAGSEKTASLDKAESLWGRLLQDNHLRDTAPSEYWEARYYWLSHQHRLGRASDVIKGIESERAWYPELGGPPWQGRILDLLEKAQADIGATKP